MLLRYGDAERAGLLRREQVGVAGIVCVVLAMTGPLGQLMGGAPLLTRTVGAAALWIYLAAIAVMLVFVAGLLTIARNLASAGGLVSVIGAGFGPRIGSAACFAALLMYAAAGGSTYAGFAGLFHDLVRFDGVARVPVALIVGVHLALVAGLGMRNIKFSVRLLAGLLCAELACLLALDGTILLRAACCGQLVAPRVMNGLPGGWGAALIWAIGSFGGFEASLVFGEEARRAGNPAPRAAIWIILALGGIFCLTYWAIANAGGGADLARVASVDPAGFVRGLAGQYLGRGAALLLQVLAMTSIFSGSLGVQNVAARYLYAAARGGLLPAWLGHIHATSGAPHRASLVLSGGFAVMLGLMLAAGADPMGRILPWCGTVASVMGLPLYAGTALAVPVLLCRQGRLHGRWLQGVALPLLSAGMFGAMLLFALHRPELVLHSRGFPPGLGLLLLLAPMAGYGLARYRRV